MKRLLILIFVFFFVSGCSYFQSKEEKTAPELASDGMDAFSSGNYKKSIELFDKLKSWYPFSKYAILAELKKADAHYELEEYEEAVFTYEEFEALHPQNEAVPYVIYQIGRCHFDQLETIDRDQTPAKKAENFLKTHMPKKLGLISRNATRAWQGMNFTSAFFISSPNTTKPPNSAL